MIPDAGPVWQCITQQFISLSLQWLPTRIRLSWCCRQKWDSSVNTMSFHSVVHVCCSSHYWWFKLLWFPVNGKWSNVCLVDIPLCYKLLWMVRADIKWCITDWICYAMVHDVAVRSITAMCTICLSSWAVVQWSGYDCPVDPLCPPASSDYISTPQLLSPTCWQISLKDNLQSL